MASSFLSVQRPSVGPHETILLLYVRIFMKIDTLGYFENLCRHFQIN